MTTTLLSSSHHQTATSLHYNRKVTSLHHHQTDIITLLLYGDIATPSPNGDITTPSPNSDITLLSPSGAFKQRASIQWCHHTLRWHCYSTIQSCHYTIPPHSYNTSLASFTDFTGPELQCRPHKNNPTFHKQLWFVITLYPTTEGQFPSSVTSRA